tara:strand:+ start:2598 stop:3401 length:804 start_codon:yes stop_codon:yes gene_type:complete
MAKKKHKTPTNTKHKSRKDLKDYTLDKDIDNMVPGSTGELQPGDRKDDKEVIDDIENMVPKTKDSDTIYPIKDMEDGDPKMSANAMKTFKKNIEDDAQDLIDTLSKKDGGYMTQIEKLTKEQKEKLVREIVKRKVAKFIVEQEEKEEEPLADTPEPEAAPEAPAMPADAEPEAEVPVEEPEAPEAEAEAPEAEAEAPEAEAPEAEAPEGDTRVQNFVTALQQKQNFIQQVEMVMKVVNQLLAADDTPRKKGKLTFLNRVIKRAIEKQ